MSRDDTDDEYEKLLDLVVRDDREAKLKLATLLVREVVGTLDQREDACEHCGIKKYANWPERQAAVVLLGAVSKIDRIRKLGIRLEKNA